MYKMERIQKRLKIMERVTSKSHFTVIYGLVTRLNSPCTMPVESLERLRRTRFYKYSLFIELIIYYVDFFIKIVE